VVDTTKAPTKPEPTPAPEKKEPEPKEPPAETKPVKVEPAKAEARGGDKTPVKKQEEPTDPYTVPDVRLRAHSPEMVSRYQQLNQEQKEEIERHNRSMNGYTDKDGKHVPGKMEMLAEVAKTSPKGSKDMQVANKIVADLVAQHNARLRDLAQRRQQLDHQRAEHDRAEGARLQPSQMSAQQEREFKTDFDNRITYHLKDKPLRDRENKPITDPEMQTSRRTALRVLTDEDARAPLFSASRNIHMYNPTIDARQATDIAVMMTTHSGNEKDKKLFKPRGYHGLNTELVGVDMPVDGSMTTVWMPRGTYASLVRLHQGVGADISEGKKRKAEQEAKDKERHAPFPVPPMREGEQFTTPGIM